MATTRKRKKKAPGKSKRKPAPKRPTAIPALLFLLLTAGLIGTLYLVSNRHLPTQNPTTRLKTPVPVHPAPGKQRKKVPKRGNQLQQIPTSSPAPQTTTKLVVYRLTQDFSQLVSTTAEIDRNLTDEEKARVIIELLTRSTHSDQAPLASTTKLRSLSFRKPLITVNLSADIRNNLINSGANDEILAVNSLVNSLLKNFPRYNSVQILIEGKKQRTLAGHIDISRPLGYQTGIATKN